MQSIFMLPYSLPYVPVSRGPVWSLILFYMFPFTHQNSTAINGEGMTEKLTSNISPKAVKLKTSNLAHNSHKPANNFPEKGVT